MSKHGRRRTIGAHVFVVVCAVSLIGLTAWVLAPAMTPPQARGSADPTETPSVPLTKADIMAETRPRFGLSAPQVPFSSAEIRRIAHQAGASPTLLLYFTKWDQDFRADAVDASYKHRALPVISWEPWEGRSAGEDQPKYSLERIASGEFDTYVRKFATDIKEHGQPVGLRFAHEMNGDWYPWSESKSGNDKGDYVQAWRHLHNVFRQVGAENVIWIWSPNIVRPVPGVDLRTLYPGDEYVDWIGLVGYAVEETTAAAVFEPTIKKLREFTDYPILITETGVKNGPGKATWIIDFAEWLQGRSDIVGFVWFEFSREQGGSDDWRFSAKPEYAAAFRAAMDIVQLAEAPAPGLGSSTPRPSGSPGS